MTNRRIKKKKTKAHTQHMYHEEYALEVAPTFFNKPTILTAKTDWYAIPTFTSAQFIGYFSLFIALLSIGMYPLLLGVAGLILGITTVSLKEDTLGYTTIIFSLFSLLFSLLSQPIF